MNKNIILVAMIIAVCASFASCINVTTMRNSATRGCGNITTIEQDVSAFCRINISSSATVRFHQSDEYRVVVTTDENMHEYVEIDTRGRTLHIGVRDNLTSVLFPRITDGSNVSITVRSGVMVINGDTVAISGASFTQLIVDVYAPTLCCVSVSGSGRFETVETLSVPSFTAIVSGSGRITSAIESDRFSATVSGSGRITAFGSSENAVIRISGSGQFNGNEFIINDAEARISGSGNANMHVTDNLEARISGSGSIRYQGNPRVDSRVTGSGRIRRAD